jgi:two-component system, OmpR family, sensor histidine kinase SenX3
MGLLPGAVRHGWTHRPRWTLIEQLLRYGGAESGKILGAREAVELRPLLEESLPATRGALAEAGSTFEEKIADDLPLIKADKESLKHALRNLLENAVKHGRKEHACIRITADRSALQGEPAVRLGIQDNGPGIPKEERARVFEPFFRGKFAIENQVHGTGLGLNLAKRIIEAYRPSAAKDTSSLRNARKAKLQTFQSGNFFNARGEFGTGGKSEISSV